MVASGRDDPLDRALARHRRLMAEGRCLGRDVATWRSSVRPADAATALRLRLMIADLRQSGAALAKLGVATGAAAETAAHGLSVSLAYLTVGRAISRAN